jgi:hypothetical protein
MARPAADEYARYYAKYLAHVSEDKVVPVLKSSLTELLTLLRDVSEEVASRLHPPYTWTIKQVIGHLTDCERVFGYRALRFARGDSTPLPGFDENVFAQSAVFRDQPLTALLAEFELVRNSHVALFENLAREDWDKRGIANNDPVSVRALAFIIAGHHRHHAAIVKERLAKV